MDAKTLKALNKSITKWERNAKAKSPNTYLLSPIDCPLCVMFFWQEESCVGCPIMQATKQAFCDGTPYGMAIRPARDWENSPRDSDLRDRAHTAAREEVAFLKSLLPENVK